MLSKMKNREKGFTLIELMIVVAIIGILAAIAIPQFASYRQRAQDSAAKSALKNLATAQENYYVEYNAYALSLSQISPWFTPESTLSVIIQAASIQGWTAVSSHKNSTNWWTYSSASGGMQ